MACKCNSSKNFNDGISFIDANFANKEKHCGCKCGCGCVPIVHPCCNHDKIEESSCPCAGTHKKCMCDSDDMGRRTCCDSDGCCAKFPCKCRDKFWPEFAHPRSLSCECLYRCGCFEEQEQEDCDCGCN